MEEPEKRKFFANLLRALQSVPDAEERTQETFAASEDIKPSEPFLRGLISHRVQEAEKALEPWLTAATEGKLNFVGAKLAFPLKYKYTANLSFAGLKGHDSILAEVLKNVRDRNKQKYLDLYLCLATKYEFGIPTPGTSRSNSSYDSDSDSHPGSDRDYTMGDLIDRSIEFNKWIGEDDESLSVGWIKELTLDFEREIVVEKQWKNFPFDAKEDGTEYVGPTGDSCPTLRLWYYTAMLFVWPKALSIFVLCELDGGVSRALNSLQNDEPNFSGPLRQIILYCQSNPLQVWAGSPDSEEDSVTPLLLRLCTRAGLKEDVLQILQLLTEARISGSTTFRIGVRSAQVAEAIAATVDSFWWNPVSSSIIDLVKNCALAQGESLVHLAKQIILTGRDEAGNNLAEIIFAALKDRIAFLAAKVPPQPAFSWRQPLARLPEQPAIENFLKADLDKLLIDRGFANIMAARDFVARYCITNDSGYSLTGTTGGNGRYAFCTLRKTLQFFEAATEDWQEKLEQVDLVRRQLEKLRLLFPQLKLPRVSTSVTPVPDGSGKQKRLANTIPDGSHNKRANKEVIDLTTDAGENHEG